MPRNAQILRQWRLWRQLAASRTALSTEQLARELGERVSARTVRRDLEVLREVGAAIQEVREGKEMRYAATDDGPALRLDADTLLALRLALGLMRPFEGTPVGECLDHLVRRLERTIPARALAYFSSIADEVSVRTTGAPSYSAREAEILDAIRRAITRGRRLQIDYAPLDGEAGVREVHPQAVVYGPRGLYLLALDETRRGAVRTFRLERIESAVATEAPARRDPSFDADAHLAGSIGVASPEHPPRPFRVRLTSAAVVRVLMENPWHESQQIQPEVEGVWTLTLELTSSRELLSRVLALGPTAEVVAPRAFRAQVRDALRRAAGRYDEGSGVTRVNGRAR